MTKEEAITFLKCDRERTCYDFKIGHCDGCNVRTALDMAIVALKAEPKHGHWITWFENKDVRQAKCSECGMMFTLGKGRDIHYCGNCGAKMDEVTEDDTVRTV